MTHLYVFFMFVSSFLSCLNITPPGTNIWGEGFRQWAVQEELLDVEKDYLYWRTNDELPGLMWDRWVDLRDAPKTWELDRFPNAELSVQSLEFNQKYKKYIQHNEALYEGQNTVYTEILTETAELYYAWDKLNDCHRPFYSKPMKRQLLKGLKEFIKEDRFYAGVMPPAAPVWRFEVASTPQN